MAEKEKEVFEQEISPEELDNVAGGNILSRGDDDRQNCTQDHFRAIYGAQGFPNCAATVGESSNCWDNDGCYHDAVVYLGMKTNCGRSWK